MSFLSNQTNSTNNRKIPNKAYNVLKCAQTLKIIKISFVHSLTSHISTITRQNNKKMSINHCCVLYNFIHKPSEKFFYSNIGQSFSRNEFFIILSIKLFFQLFACTSMKNAWASIDIHIDKNCVRFTIKIVNDPQMYVCAWLLRAHCLIMDIVMICLFHCCSLVEFDGTNKKIVSFLLLCAAWSLNVDAFIFNAE